MDIDVQRVAEQCAAQAGDSAAVLSPLAGPLAARLGGRYQAQAVLALALTLAKRVHAGLANVELGADGLLIGLDSDVSLFVLVDMLANALQLCKTQFGASETRQLVAECWPNLPA